MDLNKIIHKNDLSQCLLQSNHWVKVCYYFSFRLFAYLLCNPLSVLSWGSSSPSPALHSALGFPGAAGQGWSVGWTWEEEAHPLHSEMPQSRPPWCLERGLVLRQSYVISRAWPGRIPFSTSFCPHCLFLSFPHPPPPRPPPTMELLH